MVLSELLSTPLERQRLAVGARQSLVSFSVDAMVEATAAVLYEVSVEFLNASVRELTLPGEISVTIQAGKS